MNMKPGLVSVCVCVFYMIYPSCYNAKCASVIASVVMSVWTNG